MKIRIHHITSYEYSRPVFLDAHSIKLRPRSDGAQRVLEHEIKIRPEPAGMSESIDPMGNCALQAWFEGVTRALHIETSSLVETLRTNPFDFLLDSSAARIPVDYSRAPREALLPYLERLRINPSVDRLATRIREMTEGNTLAFLAEMNLEIRRQCASVLREGGDPLPPEVTLGKRKGSCRDLAVLFIDACRSAGFAARFVSGYASEPEDQSDRHMHAWAEVFLPGGGWRGFDPSQGLAVSDRHVAVAAGALSRMAAPITGSFRASILPAPPII